MIIEEFRSIKFLQVFCTSKTTSIVDLFSLTTSLLISSPTSQVLINSTLNHPLYKDESDERLVIRLGHKFQIDKGKFLKISDGSIGQMPYRYTNLKNIRTPIDNKVEVLKVSQQ